jgi:outer membrane protein assembly factor BamB
MTMQIRKTGLTAFVLLLCGLVAPAAAAPGDFLFKITSPEPTPGAGFGRAVAALDGDILVSEPARPRTGLDAPGRAYLYEGTTGKLKLTFDNPEPTNQDVFGFALSGGDGRAFISTSGLEARVYAFDAGSGKLLHTIEDPSGQGGGFGTGVTYADGSLLVADPSFSLNAQLFSVGQAYLFDATTGHLELTLPNPEPSRQEIFGNGISLSILDNQLVVGAMGDDSDDGRVWAFDRATREHRIALENPNPERPSQMPFSDWFGFAVAANEEIIAVGAQEDDTSGSDGSGTVYVFDSDTGALLHTLFSPQAEMNGEFGRSVAVTPEGNILVGAWRTSVNGIEGAGHAYLFDGLTGSLLLDLPNPEPGRLDAFGWSVAATDSRIIVSAHEDDFGAFPSTGAVYVFEAIPEPSTLALMGSLILTVVLLWRVRHMKERNPRFETQ